MGDGQGAVRDEANCFRFDIHQNQADPNRFHLYEVYADRAAHLAHRETPHYTKWREKVHEWFDGEPQRVEMDTIFPSEDGWKKQKRILTSW